MSIKARVTLGEFSTGQWLTVSELAKRLSIHPDTVRVWEKKGRIKCKRHPINNYRLFLWSDFEAEV